MIIKTIWERYLIKELSKVFLLFLGCFFFIYSLIDYSMHMQDFITDKQIQISHIAIYYVFQFIKRSDLLIPLSILISTLKVLLTMNSKGELIALQSCGLPRKKILRPFFLFAFMCTLFNFATSEFLLPSSLNHLDQFRQKHFKHNRHGNRKEPVHVLPLKDRSKIIYQTEDKEKKRYIDVFWIRSNDEIWRMNSLSSDPQSPVGYFVDHLERNRDGNFEKIESFDHYPFTQFRWQEDPKGNGHIPLENKNLQQLLQMLSQKDQTTAYESPQVLTHLLFKMTMPLLSLLVVVASCPFCLRYSRNLPIFFTYTIALFGFIAFFALMDAAVIVGENHVVSPYLAILLPLGLCWAAFGYNYRCNITRGI